MFHVVRLITIAALVAFTATAAAQSAGTALLTQAVAATQAGKLDYAFEFELNTSKANWRARFDPSASPRLRLVAPQRSELDNDQRRAFDRMAEDFEGVSWCASEGMGRVTNVRLLREDEASATYSFQPTREIARPCFTASIAAPKCRPPISILLTLNPPEISWPALCPASARGKSAHGLPVPPRLL